MKYLKSLPAIFLFCLFLLSGCSGTHYHQSSNGIRINFRQNQKEDLKTMQLQVINDRIIRVIATPDKRVDLQPGMMCAYGKPQKVDWKVRESGDTIILETNALRVLVSTQTGAVTFTDIAGNCLLRETEGGGKTFNVLSVDGDEGYSFRQVFDSPADEAFYGLGQHQSDVFNYKGKSESIYQYNTKVSVPFVVSNKHYGILWDNYSLTRFGDPRPYENLDQFALFDKNGHPGGLTATYMVNKDPNNVFVERKETTIDYENVETVDNFPKNFPFNNAAITWEGYLQPSETGHWSFDLYYAGYTKVWLDEKLVVAERWRTAWNPNHYTFSAWMSTDKRHKIKIEWMPDGGISYLSLKALSPLSEAEQGQLSFWSELGRQMDYYFVAGESADQVISGYRSLTGKAQVMPKWSMGFWQSRERYKTQEELLSTLRTFREEHIPIDNIVQDWSYWKEDAWGSHAFDPDRYPDPKGMVDAVHQANAQIMISVWPKFYLNTEHYKALDAKGWIYQQAIKDSIRDWIGKGYIGSFYDAFSPGARALYWKQMEESLYSLGIDAWWMDASEPDIQSNRSMDYRKKLMNPTALGSSTQYFNAYGLVNAQGIYEGQRGVDPDKRVFLLTRSGYAGSQRYAAVIWSGDIGTRWEDMKAQITAGMNFSMSGNPYWTMDNGGFCVERRYEKAKEGSEDLNEWRELNLRWHQFGAFAPLFRSHGQYPYREPWHIAPKGHPVYESMLYYNRLRYRLMPYIYTLAGRCYLDDYTIMRPLMMDFSNDSQVLNLSDQYAFGPSLMVCPVYTYKARQRSVYFPKGCDWYDLYTGACTQGGQLLTVDAPANRMPVYVKSGSILPVGAVIEHTKQAQHNLTLYVYAGQDGHLSLYEDDGTSYGYEKGAYTLLDIHWNEATGTLSLDKLKGAYPGAPSERDFTIMLVTQDKGLGLDDMPEKSVSIRYKGEPIEIPLR
ncbi:MAG: DUF5110 domain-containing protein [Bacteroidales bacterium]|nr:DUF5110 domain-containing protein [Bacteroidales bacterium]